MDSELNKEIDLKCLKLEIELKKLKEEMQKVKDNNFQLEQRYNKLSDKLMVLKEKLTRQEQHQNRMRMENRRQEYGFEVMTINNSRRVAYFVCQHPGCGKRYIKRDFFYHHQNIHSARYQCQVCQKCFISAHYLRIHLPIHNNPDPFVCYVPGCGSRFNQRRGYDIHTATKHSERTYYCTQSLCTKTFKSKYNLIQHLATDHSVFQCKKSGCDKRFNKRDDMKYHMKTHSKRF